MSQYAILRSLLSDRPIAFHPHMARVLGGINEALLFQQLAYWSDKGADPEWIYKTQKDIELETTLTRTQQENARARLRNLGVISEERRGLPAKLFFKVNWEPMFGLLEAADKDAGNLHPRVRVKATQVGGEAPGQIAADLPAITESTSERTTQRSFEASNGGPPDYDESRDVLLPLVQDIAQEFRDASPVSSTLTRVVRIQQESGLDDDAFIGRVYKARQMAKERTSMVTAGEPGRRNLVPYWLAILEDLAKPA